MTFEVKPFLFILMKSMYMRNDGGSCDGNVRNEGTREVFMVL
jgi:hypothetical protein